MKRLAIAITGLPEAGKTSFTQRLLTGSFIKSAPTLGVDVEFAEYKGYPLQIWDMGGHMAFRNLIWENYIKQSSALIFIFDASDLSKMEESKEWFWKSLSWIQKESVPILFLANKWDLVKNRDERMEKIVKGFELEKLAAEDSKRSFRFFFVSVKSGEYINEAMNWLIAKEFAKQKSMISDMILTLDLFISQDNQVLHIHDNNDERSEVSQIINAYKNKWINKSKISTISSLEEITYNNYKALFFSYPNKSLLITTQSNFIEKSPFSKFMEKIDNYKIDISDEQSRFTYYNKIKSDLGKIFHPHLSSSLSCKISMKPENIIKK